MAKRATITPPKKTTVESAAKKWLEKIHRAHEVKKEWYNNFKIALAYEYLEGRQIPPGWSPGDWITINLVYANLRSILPTYYRMDPYFYVKLARTYKPDPLMIAYYEQSAQIRQSMINYLKRELQFKDKMRLAIFDAIFQFGVIKVHHTADLIDNPAFGESLRDGDGNPVIDETTGEALYEPQYLPANEAYRITRVHPNDILFDEDSGPLEDDWNWIAQRITSPLVDVQGDKRYEKKARDSVQATESSEEIYKQQQHRKKGMAVSERSKDNDIVVKYEIYDLKHDEFMVVSEGCNDFLIKPSPIPQGIDKHPYAFLRFFLRDSSPYPIPPVATWIDPQREYCEARSRLLVHRKRFNRKYQVWPEGLQSPDEMSKLENGADGTIIQLSNNMPAVTPIQDAPMDQANFQELSWLRKDFDDVAIGPNQRGAAQGVDSATEAGIIEKRVQVQEGDDIARVMDFVTRIAEKLDMQIQVHLTQDQAIKVVGPTGEETWQLVRTSDYQDIDGEYQYSVNVAQMLPQLPEIERAQFQALLTLLVSAPQLLLSKSLMKKIFEMYHIEDPVIIDQLQQIAQQMMSGQLPMSGQQGSAPASPMMPQAVTGGGAGIANIRGGQQ
jgi:hypothetical protein